MEIIRSSRITIGKYGLSNGYGEVGAGALVRYFKLGENNFMTTGHTRSFSKKLNSGC